MPKAAKEHSGFLRRDFDHTSAAGSALSRKLAWRAWPRLRCLDWYGKGSLLLAEQHFGPPHRRKHGYAASQPVLQVPWVSGSDKMPNRT